MAGFINGIFPEQPYRFLSGMKIMKRDSSYHCLTPEMKNKHGGDHYHPGDLIPEPCASLYFS